jgi:hypothetical protein
MKDASFMECGGSKGNRGGDTALAPNGVLFQFAWLFGESAVMLTYYISIGNSSRLCLAEGPKTHRALAHFEGELEFFLIFFRKSLDAFVVLWFISCGLEEDFRAEIINLFFVCPLEFCELSCTAAYESPLILQSY